MAPNRRQNALKVKTLCEQIIQSHLSITKRFKDGVFKTGTQILSKGLDIANKLGLGLFARATKKESEDSLEASDDEVNSTAEHQKAELKWVTVYEILYKLLKLLGYEGKVELVDSSDAA